MRWDLYKAKHTGYHDGMKLLPVALVVCGAALANNAVELKQVRSVYILPMRGGMDQYLANHITREGLFEVVTDPQKASAIMTDHLGESFERKMDDLYPPPKPVKAAKDKSDKKSDGAKADTDKKDEKDSNDSGADVTVFEQPSTFGRGKGTVFLVDRQSRAVIWSTYDLPRDQRAPTLNKNADQIVRRLKHDLTAKESAAAK